MYVHADTFLYNYFTTTTLEIIIKLSLRSRGKFITKGVMGCRISYLLGYFPPKLCSTVLKTVF